MPLLAPFLKVHTSRPSLPIPSFFFPTTISPFPSSFNTMALSNNDAPFSLNDFQQLVSSAFDLHSDIPHRSASQGPVSLPSPRLEHPPTPMVSTTQVPLSSPDHDTNGHPPSLNTAATSNPRSPTSVSFVKPHRSFAPRSFISSLRSRASPILRPSNSPSAIIARSQSTTPTPSLSSTARPSLSSHRTHTPRPSQQALLHSISQTLSHPTPSSRPSSPFAFNPKDVKRAITRDRSRSLPKSFLDISRQDTPPPVPSLDDLYSFFDDSAYSMDAPVPPYARPPNPATSFPVLQVHTRLPPLRKSKSCAPALFKKQNRKQSSGAVESRSRNSSIQAIRAGIDKSDNYPFPPASRCPSPYTSPRPAPRPPTTGRLSVPGYLSDRRGSTTSTCTTVCIQVLHFSRIFPP